MSETYTVKLNARGKGSIEYSPSTYGCDYCGWTDTDKSFFYEYEGAIYCSLHKGGEASD